MQKTEVCETCICESVETQECYNSMGVSELLVVKAGLNVFIIVYLCTLYVHMCVHVHISSQYAAKLHLSKL